MVESLEPESNRLHPHYEWGLSALLSFQQEISIHDYRALLIGTHAQFHAYTVEPIEPHKRRASTSNATGTGPFFA